MSYKYFVNVPLVMQWMMGAMKMLMSKDSIQKMTWLTYGNQLAQYVGNDIPKEYGGSGEDLKAKAITPKYDNEPTKTTSSGMPTGTKPSTAAPPADAKPEASRETSDGVPKETRLDPVGNEKDAATAA